MAGRWIVLLGMFASLALVAAPARAQDSEPDPSFSPSSKFPRRSDSINKSAERIAAETAAADAAEAACKTGDADGCASLGQAYLRGEGRPQVRPVSAILLRRACDANSAKGCSDLAQLLINASGSTRRITPETLALQEKACTLGEGRTCAVLGDFLANRDDPAQRRKGEALIDRACMLGFPEGCEYPRPSPATIERRAKTACDSGESAACRALAAIWMADGRSARDRTRALALLDRQCLGRDPLACADAAAVWRATEDGDGPRTTEYLALGCTAGDAPVCAALGWAAIAKTPPDRDAARGYFERACEGPNQESACTTAADLREAPGITAACSEGDQRACDTLNEMLDRSNDALLDRPLAIAALGSACRAGALDACYPAARRTLYESPNQDDPAKGPTAIALLTHGCDGGNVQSCGTLANQLEDGQFVPRDLDRALALYLAQCEAGSAYACDRLAANNHPAAPPPLAANFDPPNRTPEEMSAELQAQMEERERAIAAVKASICRTTTAEFEGTTYSDTLCSDAQATLGGFPVLNPDKAPWQALLWRPARLGTQDVPDEYRAECGGSVIATGWILTAAHCLVDHVDGVGKFPIEKHGYRVRLGVTRPLQPEGNSYPILRVIPHPLFVRDTLAFDIALVQFDPKAGVRVGGTDLGFARIRLDTRSLAERPVEPKARVYTFGWGRTELNRPQAADVLQGVRLELRSSAECNAVTGWTDIRRDSVLCAAGPKGEQACFGDSGGPLVTYGDDKGIPTQIGVVSGGVKCGTTGKPSRYTRLGHPKIQSWLASIVPGFRSGQTAR